MKKETKILYLDLGMGAAGDMLSAALFDLLDEEGRKTFLAAMRNLGLPGVNVSAERVLKSGIAGTQFRVLIGGEEEHSEDVHGVHGHAHEHDGHGHTHDHDEHEHEHDGHGHTHEHGEHEHAHTHDHDHEHMHDGHGHTHEHGEYEHEHDHEHMHDGHGHTHDHDHEHMHDDHAHTHAGHHHHEHHSMEEIRGLIEGMNLTDALKREILSVYETIALAESRVHATSVSEIHLHEVGMKDAIADITSVCLLISMIAPDRIVASPVTTGYGHVHCAHGILPVPAPATAALLTNVPVVSGEIEGELCTPTGAALVAHFVNAYGSAPAMQVRATGYGMGKKDFPKLNCVRASLGIAWEERPASAPCTSGSGETPAACASGCEAASEACTPGDKAAFASSSEAAFTASTPNGEAAAPDGRQDRIAELACNIDDMSGEEIGFAVGELLAAGALDVWTAAIQMKKNRPGTLLTVLCREEERERFAALLFRLTTTLGVRETLHRRYVLARRTEELSAPEGTVRRKVSEGYGVVRCKEEYDDLAEAARQAHCSLREMREKLKRPSLS